MFTLLASVLRSSPQPARREAIMGDDPFSSFLAWALPHLGKRWEGYQNVQGQVKARLTDRLQDLGVRSLETYRNYLDRHPVEWARLDAMCRITVSRFYRDTEVFDRLQTDVLPTLAEEQGSVGSPFLHACCIGAASGEEPYTLRILWQHTLRNRFCGLPLHVTATEVQPHMLRRARRACYAHGSLRNLPDDWIRRAFVYDPKRDDSPHAEPFCLHPVYRRRITWDPEDVRAALPESPFSLICCRNLVFTYFQACLQRSLLWELLSRLRSGGVLVLGADETLPSGDWPLIRPYGSVPLFQHCP